MAKLVGGLFSLEARGSIGKTVTFMLWRGQQRVRKWTIPHNPESADQITIRGQFSMATVRWAGFDAAAKLLWDDEVAAQGLLMSGFNLHQGSYITYIRDEAGDPPDDPADY